MSQITLRILLLVVARNV